MATAESPGGEGIRLCLVGFGRWGEKWAKVLNAHDKLAWVVEPNDQRRAKAKYLYPHTTCTAEIPVWDLEYMDGAVVATPPSTHADVVITFLENKVAVIVEKPMTTDLASARKLNKLAADMETRLLVDHTFLGAEAVMKAFKWIPEFVGKVQYSRYVWTNTSTENQEDALWNLGPHPLSIALAMARVTETEVDNFLVNFTETLRPGVQDCVDLLLLMKDGSRANIHLSNFAPEKVREFSLTGPLGTVVCRPTLDELIARVHGKDEIKSLSKGKHTPLENILGFFLNPKPMGDEYGAVGVEVVEVLEGVSQTMGQAVTLQQERMG